ncbi:2EXR domain-containing protein [Aspergillus thermomutatus]|uniref:2EXR domain-containing protein n=1 Tax=Aspergillus thermomutatus TaxID=41047 RepID=A0A397HVW3_ASPTH|nr:uncharacterized protein CDV56_109601 [Aspergillus thermomutatus]RHZ67379.1 hypothetical protein CDV56_109601 [Aspergillus thermomutatus]
MLLDTSNFHFFPLLPPEIRLRIWSFVLSTPRIIPIERGIHPTSRRYAQAFTSPVPNPVLLRVNHEARSEALRAYRPHFRTDHAPTCIYIAFDQDVIQLPEDVLPYLGSDELDHVQSLIVEVMDTSYFGHFYLPLLRGMTRLQRLDLVVAETGRHGHSWQPDRYMALREDFHEAMAAYPEWKCPNVRIVARHTGEEMGVICAEDWN